MRRRALTLALTLALCLGSSLPVSAGDMGRAGQGPMVACGQSHTAVLQGDGTLWTTGDDSRGQLGNGAAERSMYLGKVLDQVSAVACGQYHTAAIRTDGSLWMWGSNACGALGLGMDGGDTWTGLGTNNQSKPNKGMDGVTAVACGDSFTAVIKEDGSLWMWGTNRENELGDGTEEIRFEPVKIMEDVVAVSCGSYHTAALKEDGTLWTWGSNAYGQIGVGAVGTTENRTTPVQVMDQVVAVSCGGSYTAAVRADGTLWTWGSNRWTGALGDGTTTDRSTPMQVLDQVSAVSCGSGHTAAIRTDGSLWMWGDNQHGAVGSGTYGDDVLTPVQVLEDVVDVACGQNYTAAVRADGTLWTWGHSGYGELGNGGTGNVCEEVWVPEFYLYSETIPAHMEYNYYQTVPAEVTTLVSQAGGGEPTVVGGFSDVPETAYYADAVLWAVENGITSGTTATTFGPDATCTTAQILTFLWRANGSPVPAGSNDAVPAGQYYSNAANWALEKGLTDTFNADTPATRAATMTYLWKLAGKPSADAATFTDVTAGAEYAQAVAWAVKEGITAGTSSTTFSPDSTCTRAQIMTFLYRDFAK